MLQWAVGHRQQRCSFHDAGLYRMAQKQSQQGPLEIVQSNPSSQSSSS